MVSGTFGLLGDGGLLSGGWLLTSLGVGLLNVALFGLFQRKR